jgi:hypothetical protein
MTKTKSAWVQLYEARRMSLEINARSPGRPPGSVPRKKFGTTLSKGEVRELSVWQERFSQLLERKVSTGETIGILTRICTGRLAAFGEDYTPGSLEELVDRMMNE